VPVRKKKESEGQHPLYWRKKVREKKWSASNRKKLKKEKKTDNQWANRMKGNEIEIRSTPRCTKKETNFHSKTRKGEIWKREPTILRRKRKKYTTRTHLAAVREEGGTLFPLRTRVRENNKAKANE